MASRRLPDHTSTYYKEPDARSPLFSRAWTLQEELLAPRVLYFGPDELVFRCRTSHDCLCGKSGRVWETAKYKYEEARRKASSLETARESWGGIVQQYSSLSLTNETDRLPAISGIAQAFEGRGLGEYITGLWAADLPMWLTWCRQRFTLDSVRRNYIMRSWSWASLAAGTQVRFPYYSLVGYKPCHSDVKILEIEMDAINRLRSGPIRFCGSVILAELWPIQGRKEDGRRRLKLGLWETQAVLDVVPEPGQYLQPEKVYCLLLCSVSGMVNTQSILILKTGKEIGKYWRCGIAIVYTGVRLTEDCERSTLDRPDLKIETKDDLSQRVRTCHAFKA